MFDLTAVQFIILKYLYENDKNVVIQKDICDFSSLKYSTIINVLKRLEEKELIVKKTNYTSVISITERGMTLVENIGVISGFLDDKLLKDFSKKEINELSNYLDRIYSNIGNF